jgi:hypothetical protein
MFCIFVGGWAPTFILLIIECYMPVNGIVASCLTVLCELALLFDIIVLFLYNRELRKYLKNTCRRFFPTLKLPNKFLMKFLFVKRKI